MDCYCTHYCSHRNSIYSVRASKTFLEVAHSTHTSFYCSFNHIELCGNCSSRIHVNIYKSLSLSRPWLWCLCKHFTQVSDLICPELSLFLFCFLPSFHDVSVCPLFNFIHNLFVALIMAGFFPLHSYTIWGDLSHRYPPSLDHYLLKIANASPLNKHRVHANNTQSQVWRINAANGRKTEQELNATKRKTSCAK